jgi:hypothetical protein
MTRWSIEPQVRRRIEKQLPVSALGCGHYWMWESRQVRLKLQWNCFTSRSDTAGQKISKWSGRRSHIDFRAILIRSALA